MQYHNPRRACAARVTVVAVSVCVCVCVCVCLLSVCLSVCLSVKSISPQGSSVRPENSATWSAGNKGQNICGVFSETPPFPRWSDPSLGGPYIRSAIFPADNTHAHCAYANSPRFAMDALLAVAYPGGGGAQGARAPPSASS